MSGETKGLTQQFIERLAKEAGGQEYGPRTWNISFKRDALHRFADSIAKFCESTYLAATARDGDGNRATVIDGSPIAKFVRSYQFDASDEGYVYTPTFDEQCMLEDAICSFISDSALLRSSLKASQEAEVVKLEWMDIDGDIVARNGIKSYCCRRFGDGYDLLIDGHHTKPYVHGFRETHPTIEVAQAAAQADFEARIRSCLATPQPSPDADGDAA